MSEARTKMIGKNNPKTKLTEIQVLEIRRIYNEDKISQAKLAKMYDVSQCTIFNVLNNKYWC